MLTVHYIFCIAKEERNKNTYASNFSAFVFFTNVDSMCSAVCLLLVLTAGGNTRKSKSSSEKDFEAK